MSNAFESGTIVNFLERFEKFESYGQKLSDISHDGWPIWWFVKRLFLINRLPSFLPRFSELANYKANNTKLFLLRKSLFFNEWIKFFISKFNRRAKHAEADSSNKLNILFFTHTNSLIHKNGQVSISAIGSVLEAARNDKTVNPLLVVMDPLSKNSLFKLFKHDVLYSYLTEDITATARKQANALNKKWEHFRGNIVLAGNDKLLFDSLKPALDFFFSRELVYIAIIYYECLKQLIKTRNIAAVVQYDFSDITMRASIAASHSLNKIGATVFHSLALSKSNPDLPPSGYLFVPGDFYKQKLVELGMSKKQVIVSGATFLDELGKVSPKTKSEGGVKIMIATSPRIESNMMSKEDYFGKIMRIFAEISKLKNCEVVVRMHPREIHHKDYITTAQAMGLEKISLSQGMDKLELYNLIAQSDVIINFGSTVGMEAILLKKPTINIDITQKKDPFLYNPLSEEQGLGVSIKEIGELSTILPKILNDEKYLAGFEEIGKQIISKYAYKLDGRAGQRVLEEIKNIVNSEPKIN